MDKVDTLIVEQLQINADLSNAELAEIVNVSPSTCLRRVQRLRTSGVLKKTVMLADAEKLGRGLTAMVEVYLDRHGAADKETFLSRIKLEPAISQAYSVTGDCDVILVLHLSDMKEYSALCERVFNHDRNISKFRTLFAMETYKDETAIPVDQARQE